MRRTLPDPIEDAKDVELEMIQPLAEQAHAALLKLVDMVKDNPVRALYLIERYASSQRELIGELGANKKPTEIGGSFGGMMPYGDDVNGFFNQISELVEGPTRAQRISALMRAMEAARDMGDEERANRIGALLDTDLDAMESGVIPTDLVPVARVASPTIEMQEA